MKNLLLFLLLFVCIKSNAQEKSNPLIKKFGTVYSVPFANEKPNPDFKYKILVEVNTVSEKPDLLNENLESAAKVLNLHILGGVPEKNLELVLVVHGSASLNLMNNEAYQQKFAVDNPNLPLIKALGNAGVKIFICGQSMAKRSINVNELAPEVTVALSAITTITNYAIKGFTVLKY